MADFIIGRAQFGGGFELIGGNSVLPFFLPYFDAATRPSGEYSRTLSAFDQGDGITVGTVGTAGQNNTWSFSNYPVTLIPAANLGTFLRNVLLSADCPFFYNGNRLEWFSRFNTKFKEEPFRALMPEAPSLSVDFGEVVTAFEVDASVTPPVVSAVTKERASIVFSVQKKGSGELIPDGTVMPSGTTIVGSLDADFYGTMSFNGIFNSSFSYNANAGTTSVGKFPDIIRRWNFSSAAYQPWPTN